MLCQSTHGQIALYARARLPADALSSVKIQDNRKKDMHMLELDISYIRSLRLVQPRYFLLFWMVRIDRQTMSGIGRYRLELLLMPMQFSPGA
jgi:hypothetical protein